VIMAFPGFTGAPFSGWMIDNFLSVYIGRDNPFLKLWL
jgi:hypothetical protein